MKEKDTLGEIEVPDEVFYGAQTQRALENFKISEIKVEKDLIFSLFTVKKAAALTNNKLGKLADKKRDAILKAIEYLEHNYRDLDFPVDVYQAGAGTSTNMNVNEVISKISIRILGVKIHPNDHVNMSQSTNDVYPTALRLTIFKKYRAFEKELKQLILTLDKKSDTFKNILKIGRTHLEDAAPITLGQELSGHASILRTDLDRISSSLKYIKRLNIGGTAVGTGLNAPKGYREIMIENINKLENGEFESAENLFEVMQSMSDFSLFSSTLKILSEDLIKISNDFRLLNSGPMAGMHELILPAVQPGSSIMPGKINPSIAEAMNMICFRVIGNDCTVSMANQAGQLELNVMMPIISYSILDSVNILTNGLKMFREKLVSGIEANIARCTELLNKSTAIAVLFAPRLGYDTVAKLVKEAYEKNKKFEDLINEKNLMSKKEIAKIKEGSVHN